MDQSVTSGGQEHGPGPVDRPALDQARGIEKSVGAVAADVEGALAAHPHRLTGIDDLADVGVGVGLTQLAPRHPAHLAVRLVQAEAGVDLAEPGEDLVDQSVPIAAIHQLDADGRAHDVLYAYETASRTLAVRGRAGPRARLRRLDVRHHAGALIDATAWSSADWSDIAYPVLVYVAPEMRSMSALCACRASSRSIGSTIWLIWAE